MTVSREISLPDELDFALAKLVDATGLSQDQVVALAIARYAVEMKIVGQDPFIVLREISGIELKTLSEVRG